MPSATFDRVDVREIGLRSLVKSEIIGTLGKGGILASFHTRGTLHSRKEVFKISAIGRARISAYSFKTQLGRLSGPPARELLTALSFLATVASVTDKGSSLSFRSEHCHQTPNLDGGWFSGHAQLP